MYKIAFVHSAFPDIAEAAQEAARRTGWQIEYAAAVFDEAVRLAKEYEQSGFDLIISRGVSGSLIKQALHIPVILIEITAFDILHSLFEVRQQARRIGFFQYSGQKIWDFDSIRRILRMAEDELCIYYYQTEEDLKAQIEKASHDHLDAVLATGSYVTGLIRPYGIQATMATSTKESVASAIKQAEDILVIRQRDRLLLQQQNALLDGVFAGCLLLNHEDAVIYANEGALGLLGLKRGDHRSPVTLPKCITDVSSNATVAINGRHLLVRSRVLADPDQRFSRAIYLSPPEVQKSVVERAKPVSLDGHGTRYSFADIMGKSRAITAAINKARAYAAYDANILITGESGTGKEMFAQSIHSESARRDGPFVAINCATLPHSLLQSELFGYEEGAFTGAKRGGSHGLFECAHQGTLFLDEVSEINTDDQAQLLRVLEEKSIRRVGGKKTLPVDVRIIAATNADILRKVKGGEFRSDLYFRLSVLNLRLPPLRERTDDIPLLIYHFLDKQGLRASIPELLMRKFVDYGWPGNIRELANLVEKFAILSQHESDLFHLMEEVHSELAAFAENTPAPDNSLTITVDTLRRMELEIIKCLYERPGMNRVRLAAMLDISRTHLWKKLNEIYRPRLSS
jgi:transcriptional regulator with PAS, ATPase and Fis domain